MASSPPHGSIEEVDDSPITQISPQKSQYLMSLNPMSPSKNCYRPHRSRSCLLHWSNIAMPVRYHLMIGSKNLNVMIQILLRLWLMNVSVLLMGSPWMHFGKTLIYVAQYRWQCTPLSSRCNFSQNKMDRSYSHRWIVAQDPRTQHLQIEHDNSNITNSPDHNNTKLANSWYDYDWNNKSKTAVCYH